MPRSNGRARTSIPRQNSQGGPAVTPGFMSALEDLLAYREGLRNGQGRRRSRQEEENLQDEQYAEEEFYEEEEYREEQGREYEEPLQEERQQFVPPRHQQAHRGPEANTPLRETRPPPRGQGFQHQQRYENPRYENIPRFHRQGVHDSPLGNHGEQRRHDTPVPVMMTPEEVEAMITRKMQESKKTGLQVLTDSTTSPFTQELERNRVPDALYSIKVERYNGKGDPLEHIQTHEASLLGRTRDDRYKALLFPNTLVGVASHWFWSLPKESIHSWTQLKNKFLQRYLGERKLLKGTGSLDDIKQENEETLASYYTRFNQNLAEIQGDITEGEIIRAFIRNLGRYGSTLAEKMAKKPATSLEELAGRVKTHIDLERYRMGKRIKVQAAKEENTKANKGKPPQPPQPIRQQDWRPPHPRQGTGESLRPKDVNVLKFVPLNAPPAAVLREMRHLKIWAPPSRWRHPMVGTDKDKWCDNHEAPGHETNECFSLKLSIHNAMQRGELKQFVDHGGSSAPSRPNQRDKGKEKMDYPPPPPNPNKRGTINMIHGGVASGGPSANAREVYAARIDSTVKWRKRPRDKEEMVIQFSEKDKSHIVFPHDDALVVTLDIDNFDVKRILVDGGSSADVLSLNVLESIGKSKSDLKPVSFPLVGFTGAASYPLGMITLPVTMGQGWTQLKVDVNFLVVQHLGAYNGILGRTTINPYEIVPSTVHQKMKYVTDNGIGEVLGDQRTARQCYVNSLRHRQRQPESIAVMEVGAKQAEFRKKRRLSYVRKELGVTPGPRGQVFAGLVQCQEKEEEDKTPSKEEGPKPHDEGKASAGRGNEGRPKGTPSASHHIL